MPNSTSLFEHLSYIFISLLPSFVIHQCNKTAASTLGLDKADLIGKDLLSRFHADDKASVKKIFDQYLQNPEKIMEGRHTHRWKKADNSYFWCEWQLAHSPDSYLHYFVGDDVSEQRRVKCALESIEKVTDTGYWEIDLDTHYLYWSQNVHNVHETDSATYKPKLEDGLKFYHPDSVPSLIEALKVLEETGKPYSKDFKFISSKGKQLIVNAKGFSEKSHGRVVRSFGTFKDLTKQKEDDLIRQRLEQRVVLALKAAKIGVWEYDIAGDHLNWDERVFEIYGKSEDTFTGKFQDWARALHPDDLEKAEQAFVKAMNARTYFDFKFRVITEIGEIRHVHAMASFIFDDNNQPVKATGINVDLTESETIRRHLKTTTEKAQKSAMLAQKMAQKAKAADQQKSAFLANMSHEIRTPISGILGLIDLLLKDAEQSELDTSQKQHYLHLMKSSSEHLLSIISDILDFSKIEAGKINIYHEPLDFVALTATLMSEFERQASAKGIAFDCRYLGFENSMVLGDSLRLKQILYNLLGNAIKFTPTGTITVCITLSSTTANTAVLSCSVADTGIGIPHHKVGLLFRPFEQVDSSSVRTSQGTGLGLAITHELISLMNGTITVDSELHKGSNFTFTLPLETLMAEPGNSVTKNNQPPQTMSDLSFANYCALVAEDNEINQVVIESLLSQLGISCVLADNGQEALRQLREQPVSRFDFILMDCQMPVLDGFETTRIIRRRKDYVALKHIPIIALTANAMMGDREKCLQAGMDEYLSKPVTKEVLLAKLMATLQPIQ